MHEGLECVCVRAKRYIYVFCYKHATLTCVVVTIIFLAELCTILLMTTFLVDLRILNNCVMHTMASATAKIGIRILENRIPRNIFFGVLTRRIVGN